MYTIIELKFLISVLEQKVGFWAGTLKMLIRKANRPEGRPDQTAATETV